MEVLKNFVKRIFPFSLVTLIATFAVFLTVSASTTISTSITTGGLLTVSGSGTSTLTGIQGTYLNLTGTSATSTASNGFNLTSGCFAVNGACVAANGASTVIANTFTALQTFSSGASTTQLSASGNVWVNGYATTTAANGNIATQGTLNVTGLTTLGQASSTLLSCTAPCYFGGTATSSFSTAGALTLASPLSVANGGTGWANISAGFIPFGNGASALSTSTNLFWDNTNNRLGVSSSTPYVALGVTGTTTSTAGNVIGSGGSGITQLLFGTCTVNPGAIAASTTVSTNCTATGVSTLDRVFVTPQSLPVSLIFTGASSTGSNTIQVSIYNATSSGSNTPASMTWSWLAIH